MNITKLQPYLLQWRAEGLTRVSFVYDTNANLEITYWYWDTTPHYSPFPSAADILKELIGVDLQADWESNDYPDDVDHYRGTVWIDLEAQTIHHDFHANFVTPGPDRTNERPLN